MAQDCFLTFGIRRQMIMMQPGKLSILPLESKQWGNAGINDGKTYGDFSLPISVSNVLAVFALDFDTSSSNGASIGDYYTVTYKPSFSNNSRLRFVTKGAAMGGFNALVICK